VTGVDDITALRQRIDAIDQQLVTLLNERAGCALEIGRWKEQSGQAIYQPAREAEVLANVRAGNRGPLDHGAMTRLFERVIDEARRLERIAAARGEPQFGEGESVRVREGDKTERE
jgi:chorismate mutase